MTSGNGDKPATKADVAAVKADLQGARTELKADVESVRTELKGVETRLAKEIVNTQAHLRRIEESIPTKEAWDRLFNTLTETMGAAKDNRNTLLVYDKILSKHRKTLEEHDGRITTLEAKA